MKRAAVLLVITVLLQLAVGADYFWIPNSNWDEPGNWALGRPPCGGEVASFASTPAGSLIYLNSDVTVRSIQLPPNGKIVLKPSVTIRFSNEASCENPLVADVKDGQEDVFTGARDNLWECPENWVQADNRPADRPPCRGDNAIFERDSAYSFVTSKTDITINSLTVRGVELKSLDALTNPSLEFKLKVAVEPRCADDPSLCPCPSQDSCGTTASQKGSSKAALAAGVSVAIFVIVAITVTIVVIVVIVYVRRRHGSYTKDDLMEPDENIVYKSEHSKTSEDAVAFDNPLYDATTGEVHLAGYEVKEASFKPQPGEEMASTSSGMKSGKPEDLKPILDDPEWETF